MLTRSSQLYSSGPLPVTLSRNTRVLSNNDDNSNKQNNNFTHRAHILVHFFAISVRPLCVMFYGRRSLDLSFVSKHSTPGKFIYI